MTRRVNTDDSFGALYDWGAAGGKREWWTGAIGTRKHSERPDVCGRIAGSADRDVITDEFRIASKSACHHANEWLRREHTADRIRKRDPGQVASFQMGNLMRENGAPLGRPKRREGGGNADLAARHCGRGSDVRRDADPDNVSAERQPARIEA